jgi:tetrahedral aminopeptidase
VQATGQLDPDQCSGVSLRFPGGVRATLGVISSPGGDGDPPRMLADFGGDHHGDMPSVGTMGVLATPWQVQRTTIEGKALDGRIGAAIALEVARRTASSANTLVLALTTLGQLSHRSLQAAATELAPTAAIVLGTHPVSPTRTPGSTDVRPGKGPVLLLRTEQFVADQSLVETLRQAAARARIPCQLAVAGEDSTGAAVIQSCLEGIPTAAVLVPCTGVGAPRQRVEIRDLEAAVELLAKLIARPLAI